MAYIDSYKSGAGVLNAVTDLLMVPTKSADNTSKMNNLFAECDGMRLKPIFPPGFYNFMYGLNVGGKAATQQSGDLPTGQAVVQGFPGRVFFNQTAAGGAVFKGHISGNTLTVESITSGTLGQGHTIRGGTYTTTIDGYGTGTGGTGTYHVQDSQTVANGTSMTSTSPILMIGNANSPDGLMRGAVHGICISGPSAAPSDGSIGLLMNGMTHISVTNVTVDNCDIGMDMINNCYATSFRDVHVGSGGSCNVALNIRGGVDATGNAVYGQGAGNQIPLNNSWLTGNVAGVHIANTDGLGIHDGQVGCSGSDSDNIGPFIIGKDYLSQTTQNTGKIVIDNVDMENFRGWALNVQSQVSLNVRSSKILSNGGSGREGRGVLNINNGQNSHISLQDNDISGNFLSAVPIKMNNFYGGGSIREFGSFLSQAVFGVTVTSNNGTYTTSGGTNIDQGQNLLEPSGCPGQGIGIFRAYDRGTIYLVGNQRLIFDGNGNLKTSIDGTTFNPVSVAGAVAPISPANISGLIGWYQAHRILGQADNSATATLPDNSGSSNNATQTTAANQAKLITSRNTYHLPSGGQPVLHFDGTLDGTGGTAFFNTPITSNVLSVAAVFNVPVRPNNNTQGIIGGAGNGTFALRFGLGNNPPAVQIQSDNVTLIGQANLPAPPTADNYHVIAASYANPGAWFITLDGVLLASGTSSVTFASGQNVVLAKTLGSGAFPGHIAEWVLSTQALSQTTMAGLTAWLMREYSI